MLFRPCQPAPDYVSPVVCRMTDAVPVWSAHDLPLQVQAGPLAGDSPRAKVSATRQAASQGVLGTAFKQCSRIARNSPEIASCADPLR